MGEGDWVVVSDTKITTQAPPAGAGSYDSLGPANPGTPGDTLELFAVGLGPTGPPVSAGQAFSGSAPKVSPVSLLVNNTIVMPSYAGMTEAGLYQINLTIPPGLGTGDVPLSASLGGSVTQPGVVISLQ